VEGIDFKDLPSLAKELDPSILLTECLYPLEGYGYNDDFIDVW